MSDKPEHTWRITNQTDEMKRLERELAAERERGEKAVTDLALKVQTLVELLEHIRKDLEPMGHWAVQEIDAALAKVKEAK
jgi:hypothetical protein